MTNGVLQRPQHRARYVITIALFLALTARAHADAPSAALKAIVKELAAEAQTIIKSNDVPKGQPDYASRCAHDVSPVEIGTALTQRTHREPFVDAYIRWQLTSFDAPLPEMDARTFATFMDDAPKMIENPRAHQAVLDVFERVDNIGKLQPSDLERLRSQYDELEKHTQIAELMNRPALEFRESIGAKLGETGVNTRLWLLEECVATVQAGWSTRSVKSRISRSFLSASSDANITRDHLRLLSEQTRKLTDIKRRFVNEVTIFADGSVKVSFSTAGVTDHDVEGWINRLAGVP